jgi:hypothetical protein
MHGQQWIILTSIFRASAQAQPIDAWPCRYFQMSFVALLVAKNHKSCETQVPKREGLRKASCSGMVAPKRSFSSRLQSNQFWQSSLHFKPPPFRRRELFVGMSLLIERNMIWLNIPAGAVWLGRVARLEVNPSSWSSLFRAHTWALLSVNSTLL